MNVLLCCGKNSESLNKNDNMKVDEWMSQFISSCVLFMGENPCCLLINHVYLKTVFKNE